MNILEFLQKFKGGAGDSVMIDGQENLLGSLGDSRGCFILCIHMGSWEAMGGALTNKVRPSHVIVKKIAIASVNRFLEEVRQANNFLAIKRKL